MISLVTYTEHLLLRHFNFVHMCSVSSYYLSKAFPPPKNSVQRMEESLSLAQRLMLENGIIASQHPGLFTLLPLGQRSVEKLVKIIDTQMKMGECQKINLPSLTSASLWKKSGRLEASGKEVMHFFDRHNQQLILSPTHEEPICELVKHFNLDHSSLPLRLYQVSYKFRDEMRLKHGLIRGREFLMKDLYTFDKNIKEAKVTYEIITNIYSETFKLLDLPILKVDAAVGSIGGLKSHEFHIPNKIGEDLLMTCNNCDYAANSELGTTNNSCPNCKEQLKSVNGIEVGHAFLLGTKYSTPLSVSYRDFNGKANVIEMGCYGIGVTRLLSAGIEVLSHEDQLVWPKSLAPYKVCLIPPKKGSREEHNNYWCNHLEHIINQIPGYGDEVAVDDRTKLSIGFRLNQAKKFGYPFIIVIGKDSLSNIPIFELFSYEKNIVLKLTQSDIIEYLSNECYKTFK